MPLTIPAYLPHLRINGTAFSFLLLASRRENFSSEGWKLHQMHCSGISPVEPRHSQAVTSSCQNAEDEHHGAPAVAQGHPMLLYPGASPTNCSSPSLQDQVQTSPELHSIRSMEKFKRNSPLQHKPKLFSSSPSCCLCIRLPEGSHLSVRNQLSHREPAKATSTLPENLIQCMSCSGFEEILCTCIWGRILLDLLSCLNAREKRMGKRWGHSKHPSLNSYQKRPQLSQTAHGLRDECSSATEQRGTPVPSTILEHSCVAVPSLQVKPHQRRPPTSQIQLTTASSQHNQVVQHTTSNLTQVIQWGQQTGGRMWAREVTSLLTSLWVGKQRRESSSKLGKPAAISGPNSNFGACSKLQTSGRYVSIMDAAQQGCQLSALSSQQLANTVMFGFQAIIFPVMRSHTISDIDI